MHWLQSFQKPPHPLHHFLVIIMHKKPVEKHRSMMAALIAQEIKHISIVTFIIYSDGRMILPIICRVSLPSYQVLQR